MTAHQGLAAGETQFPYPHADSKMHHPEQFFIGKEFVAGQFVEFTPWRTVAATKVALIGQRQTEIADGP